MLVPPKWTWGHWTSSVLLSKGATLNKSFLFLFLFNIACLFYQHTKDAQPNLLCWSSLGFDPKLTNDTAEAIFINEEVDTEPLRQCNKRCLFHIYKKKPKSPNCIRLPLHLPRRLMYLLTNTISFESQEQNTVPVVQNSIVFYVLSVTVTNW